jgi:hypothetical protein
MPNQPNLAATLFPLSGLEGHVYSLRFLRVAAAMPNDDLQVVRMQKWAMELWRTLRCPVIPTRRQNAPGFLVPASVSFAATPVVAHVHDVPDRTYPIETTDDVFTITPKSASPAERDLAAKIIERSISDVFKAQPQHFWRVRWNLYFNLEPDNKGADDDLVNAYRGIRFSVVFLDGKPFLAADVQTRYIGRKSLAHHSPEERADLLREHLNLDIKFEDRALFVRDNGCKKFSCKYAGETGQTIGGFVFGEDKRTVLDYYRQTYPKVSVNPGDAAVFVRDHGRPDPYAVPASCLYPIFTTEEEGMRSCSVEPWMSPDDRIYALRLFLNRIGRVQIEGKTVTCSLDPAVFPRAVFPPPSLEFGREQCLACPCAGQGPTEAEFNAWRADKTNYLYQHGTYSTQPLPDLALLYPETMPRVDRERFLKLVVDELAALTGNRVTVGRQICYRLGMNPRTGAGILGEARQLAEASQTTLPIIVLARQLGGHVYGELKNTLAAMPTQCVTEWGVGRMFRDGKGSSRVRNLTLGVLTAAGIQPWVLADALAHDFYAGIDVLQNRVSYSFLYGRGGRSSYIDFGEFNQRNRLHESINPVDLRSKLRGGLMSARSAGVHLRSVVIHRDGRWWSREDSALTGLITELKRDGSLDRDCRVAVLEIRKSHLPVRLFGARADAFENPMPGSHLRLDDDSVVMTTTGKPGTWDRQGRSASTLLLRLARRDGDFSIEELARDAYYLTHLNWNAPEIEISLPVTIRWNDDALRYARLSDVDEDGEADDKEAA